MVNWIRNLFLFTAAVLATLTLGPILGVDAADAPSSPIYVVKGDLAEVKSKGTIRFLVHGEADYLPRAGDPRAAERALAEDLARKLGLAAVFVPVASLKPAPTTTRFRGYDGGAVADLLCEL